MKIADVQLGTEYVLDAWRTNVLRATATAIVTRDEGTMNHPRNVRVVELTATRVTPPTSGHGRNSYKIGDTIVLPARDLTKPAKQADAEQRAREERELAEREAIEALGGALTEVGFAQRVRRYNAREVHAVFTFEEAHEFARFLTTTVTKAREFDLTEAEIQQ